MYRGGHAEDKTGDKGKSSAFPPSGSGDAEDIDNSSELLSAWMDRMQTLTVVVRLVSHYRPLPGIDEKQTTFLVNMDSQLFSLTAIPTNLSINAKEIYQQLVYCCICGALIFHICAGECITNQPNFHYPISCVSYNCVHCIVCAASLSNCRCVLWRRSPCFTAKSMDDSKSTRSAYPQDCT